MPEPVRITLRAELDSALHILGPGRAAALLERPIELDPQGYPLIPASSIRGRLRVHLERLLVTLGLPVCSPPLANWMCPHRWGQGGNAPADGLCLACRIFGGPWSEATLISDDLLLDPAQRTTAALLRTMRASVAISRRLMTAQPERLFTTETTPRSLGATPLHFSGALHGRLEPLEAGFVLAATRLVTHIGGGKARGLGALRLTVAELAWWRDQTWVAGNPQALIEEALRHATP